MKSKGKVDKTSNLNILKLNLEQIYTKPFNKPSNVITSAKHSNNASTRQIQQIRLDSDTSRARRSSPSLYLPQTAKTNTEADSLLHFSSKLQDLSHSMQQYLKSFKGNAFNQLNFEDLGTYVFDARSAGLNRALSDNEHILKQRHVTDVTTASTLSQTIGSASRFLGRNQNDYHTQSFTARSPTIRPIFGPTSPNMRPHKVASSKATTRPSTEGIEVDLREKLDLQETGRRGKMIVNSEKKKKAINLKRNKQQRRIQTVVQAVTSKEVEIMESRDRNKEKGLTMMRKKKNHTANIENSMISAIKAEDTVLLKHFSDNQTNASISMREPAILRSNTEGDRLKYGWKSDRKVFEDIQVGRKGSLGQLVKAKKKEKVMEIETNRAFGLMEDMDLKSQDIIEPQQNGEPGLGKFNILKLDLGKVREDIEEEKMQGIVMMQEEKEEKKDMISNISILGVISQVLGNKIAQGEGFQSPRGVKSGNQSPKRSTTRELMNLERKERLKKSFRDTVRAVKVGRKFLNSVKKREDSADLIMRKDSSPTNNAKNRTMSVDSSGSPKRGNEGELTFTFMKKGKVMGTPSPPKIVVTKNSMNFKDEDVNSADKVPKKSFSDTKSGKKVSQKVVSILEKIPMIRVIGSENNSVLIQHNSKSNSRRASKIEDPNMLFTEKKPVAGDPKSWFDFKTKPVMKKLKKLRSMKNNPEIVTSSDNRDKFIAAFNNMLKVWKNKQTSTSITGFKVLEENEPPPQKGIHKQVSSKKLEELLEEDESSDLVKKMTSLENEMSPQTKIPNLPHVPHPVKRIVTINGKEEFERGSLKMYSRRSDVIIININPPIEEVNSKMEETMSPMTAYSNRSLMERLESTENGNIEQNEIPKVLQYTFDLNPRKSLEMESSMIEDLSQNNAMELSFRKRAEDLFKFDEIYKSKMDNFNTKSQRLRVQSNFLTFVEKTIVLPTERWAHIDIINNYVVSEKKEASSLLSIHCEHSGFEYSAKTFSLSNKPFIDRLNFRLTIDHLKYENRLTKRKHQQIDEAQFEEDDNENERSRLRGINLFFESGEISAPKSILDDEDMVNEYKRNLENRTIIVSQNFETLSRMQKQWFNCSEPPTPIDLIFPQREALRYALSKVLPNVSGKNWKYIKQCIHRMYGKDLYGLFEYKEELGNEKITPRDNDKSLDKVEEVSEIKAKKREQFVSGKLWRSASNVSVMFNRSSKKTNTEGPLAARNAHLQIAVEESKEEEEEDAKEEEVKLGDNLKQMQQYQQRQRRRSKTDIKPLSHSNTQNKANTSNIEKSITVGVEANIRGITATLLVKDGKRNKISHTDSTADRTDKLQIPRKNSMRQNLSGSPRSRQEIKSDNAEKKAKKIPTINHSLTPSSDRSSPHREDHNGLNNQSTLNVQFGRERTKTKLEVSERSSTLRRDLSYGAISQTREKEEITQHILWDLHPRGKEDNNNKQAVVAMSRKEINEKSPVMRGTTEKSLKNEIAVKPRNKARYNKYKPKDTVEELLFDCIYTNKYLETRESLNFYPKEVIHMRDKEMNTLLIVAAKLGHLEIAELLLSQGGELNAQNKQGNTALHVALAYHHYNVADMLVKHGAKQNIVNNKGKTPWDEVG